MPKEKGEVQLTVCIRDRGLADAIRMLAREADQSVDGFVSDFLAAGIRMADEAAKREKAKEAQG